jgi:hypothetical protein
MSIQVWATDRNGNGMVQKLGEYEDIEDVVINCGHFRKDVVITFNYKPDEP